MMERTAAAVPVFSCTGCGRVNFGGDGSCGHCGAPLEEKKVSGRGNIYAFSVVHVAPEEMDAPYTLALVDLEGAGRVLCRLDGFGADLPEVGHPTVGGPVVFEGVSPRGPLFRTEVFSENARG
jgi:uncharacterized OB-fold protein